MTYQLRGPTAIVGQHVSLLQPYFQYSTLGLAQLAVSASPLGDIFVRQE